MQWNLWQGLKEKYDGFESALQPMLAVLPRRHDCLVTLGPPSTFNRSNFRVVSVGDMRRAQSSRCMLCTLVFDGLSTMIPDVANGRAETEIAVYTSLVRIDLGMYGQASPRMSFQMVPGKPSIWHSLPSGILLPQDFEEPSCIARIKEWLSDCVQGANHVKCTLPNHDYLPSRLLDVHRCALVESDRTKITVDRTRYAALSHCWGTAISFTTTRENLASRKAGFNLDNVPKTFRDAMILCRKLDIAFIWIDSLCIIQDDLTDWEEQSAVMGDIYENSYITINASSAAGDEIGFLKPQWEYRGVVLTSKDSKDGPDIVVRRDIEHYQVDSRIHQPLTKRAWCLQEEAVSPRTIAFHAEELHWHCRSGMACECGGLYRWRHRAPKHPKELHQEASTKLPSVSQFSHWILRDVYNYWYDTVVDYSGRALTKANDRLPAISGVANRVKVVTQDNYMAGLWLGDLPAGLSWRTDGVVNLEWQPTHLAYAPSFSWVSVATKVKFEARHLTHDEFFNQSTQPVKSTGLITDKRVRIVEGECVPDTMNSLGTVSDGWLKLKSWGFYTKLMYRSTHSNGEKYIFEHLGNYNYDPDGDLRPEITEGTENHGRMTARRGRPEDHPAGSFDAEVLVFLLFETKYEEGGSGGNAGMAEGEYWSRQGLSHYCLLLGCPTVERPHYQRLGMLRFSGLEDGGLMTARGAKEMEITLG